MSLTNMSPTASWRHRSHTFTDQSYADTVLRTITSAYDGKIKD